MELPFVLTQRFTTDHWQHYVPSPGGDDVFAAHVAMSPTGDRAAVTLSRGADWHSRDVFLLYRDTKNSDDENEDERQEWIPQGIVKAWDGDQYDRFGEDMAIYKNTMVVGSPYDDFYSNDHRIGDPGGAYVFEWDEVHNVWSSICKLQPADRVGLHSSYYWFGASVGLWEDILVVGAEQAGYMSDRLGSAYIFQKDIGTSSESTTPSWIQSAKLMPSNGVRGNQFGNQVAVTNGFVVVGAPCSGCKVEEVGLGMERGAVYVFEKDPQSSDWTEIQLNVPTDSLLFGSSIAAAENTIVVGAPGTQDTKGSVYVFEKRYSMTSSEDGNQWQLAATLIANDRIEKDYFGRSVGIDAGGENVFIGNGMFRSARKCVYQFHKVNHQDWRQTHRIVGSSELSFNDFGRSLAVAGNSLLVTGSGDARKWDNYVPSEDHPDRGMLFAFEKGAQALPNNNDNGPKPAKPKRTKPDFRGDFSKWTNLVVSLLLLYIIHKVFMRS